MNHMGTKIIETDRLILRPFNIDDAEYMFNNWAKEPEVTKYLTWTAHKSVQNCVEYINFLLKQYNNKEVYDWGLELKEIGEVIGSIGAVRVDSKVCSVHIGYALGKNWWHQGIMSEAFSAIIKFFMEEVKVNRIEARHDVRNINSGRVMEKCGLKYEGNLRQSDMNNQGICDAAYYGILRGEYDKMCK